MCFCLRGEVQDILTGPYNSKSKLKGKTLRLEVELGIGWGSGQRFVGLGFG